MVPEKRLLKKWSPTKLVANKWSAKVWRKVILAGGEEGEGTVKLSQLILLSCMMYVSTLPHLKINEKAC